MVDETGLETTQQNTAQIDARPYQLNLLKLERREMRPMALKVLNQSTSTKVKLAAVAGVAAMLVSLNTTSDAYAAKLNLKPAVAEQSTQVIRNAVACCDQIAEFVSLDASQTALKEQVTNLFLLIDDEHKRLEGFADELGARLVQAGGLPVSKDEKKAVQGGGGKDNASWLAKSGIVSAVLPDLEVEDGVQGGGGKDNVLWLNRL